MKFTPGPWEIVPTVSSDRRIFFGIAPLREFHIGTFVSGSRKELDTFKSNLALMSYSPLMFSLLEEITELLRSGTVEPEQTEQLGKKGHRLLKKIRLAAEKNKKAA